MCVRAAYTHTHSSKSSRKSQGGDKVSDSGFGKILRGQLRVCLFLDYSDRAIRKNRLCLSCSVPPSSAARKGIRPNCDHGTVGPSSVRVPVAVQQVLLHPAWGDARSPDPGSVQKELGFRRRTCCLWRLKSPAHSG